MHAPAEYTEAEVVAVPADLAALQGRMASALLAADETQQRLPANWFAGAHPGAAGLWVHRNTVLGALAHALRLSHIAVDRLVGEAFFDRMAVEYARAAPPAAPQLDAYGAEFAAFIEHFPGTAGLPYLSELARFDWQLDILGRLAGDAGSPRAVLLLDGGVCLEFASTLRLHTARFAVDQLRAAILAEDAQALGAVDLCPGVYHYALWRADSGVMVQLLSVTAMRLVQAALAGASGPQALALAAGDDSAEVSFGILSREILPAGFVQISKDLT